MSVAVRSLDVAALPHVPAGAPLITREAARSLARLSRGVSVPLRGVGTVHVMPDRLSFEPLPAAGEHFALMAGEERGVVQLDAALALGIAAAVLGSPTPVMVRALGRSERGVVGAAIAAFLMGAGSDLGIDLAGDTTGTSVGSAVRLGLRIRGAGLAGRGMLQIPLAWLPRPRPPFALPAAISISFALVLGTTNVAAGALASARPGDAVVFDELPWPPPSDAWPIEVRAGDACAAGELHADGLRLVGAFTTITQEDPHMAADDRTATAATLPDALAAASVEVVAQLGRVTLRMDELAGLIEGGVIAVGANRRDLVTLRVGGRLWARGELVTVDGALGVRITERIDGR